MYEFGMAWETTPEDIMIVLGRMQVSMDADDIIGQLDHGAIAKAALDGGVEIDDQTEAAYDEIEKQITLIDAGV